MNNKKAHKATFFIRLLSGLMILIAFVIVIVLVFARNFSIIVLPVCAVLLFCMLLTALHRLNYWCKLCDDLEMNVKKHNLSQQLEIKKRKRAEAALKKSNKKLHQNVAGLVATTRQLASGNLAARSAIEGNDEMAEVAGAFNLMADRIAADILHREQVEEELRESEKRFRNVFNLQFQFIAILSPEGRVLDINDLPLRAGGVTREEVTGKLFWETAWWRTLPAMRAGWPGRLKAAAHIEGPVLSEDEFNVASGEVRIASIAITAVKNKSGELECYIVQGNDITDRKRADAELENMHRELLDVSRRAGRAEVATNVLHNVGNVLNSVNISACMLLDSIKKSRASNLAKLVALLQENKEDPGAFIANDPKGQRIPAYLAQLTAQLQTEQESALLELDSLLKNIEHIKEIVTMQQSYTDGAGFKETINIREFVEDCVRMNINTLKRHRIRLICEIDDVPLINIDRHKVLQVLVNLIRNAEYACQNSDRSDREITINVSSSGRWIKISVMDNGLGIAAENLTRIFNYGFTTRKDGHGFGLHSSALAAQEMGGSLTAYSNGPGQGAVFILELPCFEHEH